VIAAEIAETVVNAGFEVVGPAENVDEALKTLDREGCDAAVLDVKLGEETAETIAVELAARDTPFVVVSGRARSEIPEVLRDAPNLAKPLRARDLEAELERCLERRTP